jgi:hypothetical protein
MSDVQSEEITLERRNGERSYDDMGFFRENTLGKRRDEDGMTHVLPR